MARKKTEDQPELAAAPDAPNPVPTPKEWDLHLELVTEHVCVALSDDEVLTRGEDLAKALKEYDEAELRKKAAAEEMKMADEKVNTLKRAVLYRQEVRPVTCVQTPDWETHRVSVQREDTGEIVRWREMTLDERTPPLPLVTGDAAPKE